MIDAAMREKILIVDDEPRNIRVLGETLRQQYQVFSATSGEEALHLAAQISPDLILLDIRMPTMDGYELCRTLQGDPLLQSIPLIFVSSLSGEEDESIGLALGAVDYITRPFRPAIVRQRIRNQLELKRRREEQLHRMEGALQESEERFRLFMDQSPTIAWIKDEEGRYVYLNKSFEQRFQVRSREISGKSDTELWPHEIARELRKNDLAVLAAGTPQVFTEKNLTPDGATCYWLSTKFPFSDSSGNRYIGGIGLDISERTRLEQERERQLEEISTLKQQADRENSYLRAEIRDKQESREVVTASQSMKQILAQAKLIAKTDSTVLVQGETGTGKELLARYLHQQSRRSERNLYKLSCAAIPATLLENELFGHERGAFTGAQERQIGHFELADRATLFLDEIGELSLEAQAKLLRVIQEGEFSRVGSPKVLKTDVRIIAATNRNLAEEVRQGRFRGDLYYRLSVFPLILPPLRERTEDIPQLVWSFVHDLGARMGKSITIIPPREMAALQQYSWPGNVRELRNVVENALIFSHDDRLQLCLPSPQPQAGQGDLSLQQLEYRHISDILNSTNGRVHGARGAAGILGIHPNTLYSRMKKLGIPTRRPLDEIS